MHPRASTAAWPGRSSPADCPSTITDSAAQSVELRYTILALCTTARRARALEAEAAEQGRAAWWTKDSRWAFSSASPAWDLSARRNCSARGRNGKLLSTREVTSGAVRRADRRGSLHLHAAAAHGRPPQPAPGTGAFRQQLQALARQADFPLFVPRMVPPGLVPRAPPLDAPLDVCSSACRPTRQRRRPSPGSGGLQIIERLPAGLLSDRIGRKASFILGDGIGAIISLLNVLLTNFSLQGGKPTRFSRGRNTRCFSPPGVVDYGRAKALSTESNSCGPGTFTTRCLTGSSRESSAG